MNTCLDYFIATAADGGVVRAIVDNSIGDRNDFQSRVSRQLTATKRNCCCRLPRPQHTKLADRHMRRDIRHRPFAM